MFVGELAEGHGQGLAQLLRLGTRWRPAFAAMALAQQTALAQGLRTTHVVDDIYLITGAGGNVTVSVGHSGVLIVDSGSADMSPKSV